MARAETGETVVASYRPSKVHGASLYPPPIEWSNRGVWRLEEGGEWQGVRGSSPSLRNGSPSQVVHSWPNWGASSGQYGTSEKLFQIHIDNVPYARDVDTRAGPNPLWGRPSTRLPTESRKCAPSTVPYTTFSCARRTSQISAHGASSSRRCPGWKKVQLSFSFRRFRRSATNITSPVSIHDPNPKSDNIHTISTTSLPYMRARALDPSPRPASAPLPLPLPFACPYSPPPPPSLPDLSHFPRSTSDRSKSGRAPHPHHPTHDLLVTVYKKFSNGDTYQGGWLDGQPHGEGTYTWSTGGMYQGSWQGGEKHGVGAYTWANGATYEGEWSQGFMHGVGLYGAPDGSLYEGGFRRDGKHGLGRKVRVFCSLVEVIHMREGIRF